MLYPALMTTTTISTAWQAARATPVSRARAERRSVLLALVSAVARALPFWPKVRTATMQLTAFAFLDYAAWRWSVIAGCVSIGVSLLILEALSDSKPRARR